MEDIQSWEKTWQFAVRNGEVFVAPVIIRCVDCDFITHVGKEILEHTVTHGHFYSIQPQTDKVEKWRAAKHPQVPLNVVKRQMQDTNTE